MAYGIKFGIRNFLYVYRKFMKIDSHVPRSELRAIPLVGGAPLTSPPAGWRTTPSASV